jgi:hypothetical protein
MPKATAGTMTETHPTKYANGKMFFCRIDKGKNKKSPNPAGKFKPWRKAL